MIRKITIAWGMYCITLTTAFAQAAATQEPIKGSPYVNEKYVDGTIYYADKSMTAPLRYNAFQDVMEYQQSGKALILDAKQNITRILVGAETYIPHAYETDGKQKNGFFAVLDSGEMMLLCRKSIVYQAPLKGRALDGSDLPAQYKPAPDAFYYKVGNSPLKELVNIKTMLADLPENQSVMADYVKKERISVKKEKDVVMVVEHYNKLQSGANN